MRTLIVSAALAATFASAGHAVPVLTLDLETTNQVTITATPGASAATASGSDSMGFYLADAFATGGGTMSFDSSLQSGNLTSAENTSDNTPNLTHFRGSLGLNVWSYTGDSQGSFVQGNQAFSGSATWTIDAASYNDLLAGPVSGSVYFPADSDDDIPDAALIGEWTRTDATVIPLPASAWMLIAAVFGLGGLRARASNRA